jgi:hypothetical protein
MEIRFDMTELTKILKDSGDKGMYRNSDLGKENPSCSGQLLEE